jgi:hypothetical protein
MSSSRRFAATLIAALVIVSATGTAQADALLSRADGKWSGSGWFKNGIDAPKEAARCRYSNSVNASGEELTISGKCSVGGRTFTTSGTIRSIGSGGGYSGGWSNPRGPGTISLQGQKSGSRITFTFRAREETSGEYLPHRSTWHISRSKLRLVGSVKNPDTGRFSELSIMEFSR